MRHYSPAPRPTACSAYYPGIAAPSYTTLGQPPVLRSQIVNVSPPFSGANPAPTPSNTTSSGQYPTTYTTTPINSMGLQAEPSQKIATGSQPQQGLNNPGPNPGAGATQFLDGGGLYIPGRLPANINREDRRICEGHYIRGSWCDLCRGAPSCTAVGHDWAKYCWHCM